MTSKYEFGFGEGEIYRRRMRGREQMRRDAAKRRQDLPEEDRERRQYDSDYYGFHGAGRREANVRPGRAHRRSR